MAKHKKKPGLLDPNSLPRDVSRAERGIETRFKDGGGLSLLVTEAGTAKWVHRFPFRGRYPEMWLGNFPADLTLSEARAKRDANDKLLEAGINPLDVREAGADLTFGEFCIKHRARLAPPMQRDPDKPSEWLLDMTKRVGALADLKISEVRFQDARHAMEPYWDGLRPRPHGVKITSAISRVLAFWHALERPEDDHWNNPVTLKRMKVALGDADHHVVHYASMPFWDLPAFIPKLRARNSYAAQAAEFVIFSGAPRVAEAAASRFRELHWDGTMAGRRSMTWTIPPDRRKTQRNKGPEGKPHVVPINLGMLRVINRARKNRRDVGPNDLIFPSYYLKGTRGRAPKPSPVGLAYSGTAILQQIKRAAGGKDYPITTHGFRTSVSDWGVTISHRKLPPFAMEVMDRVLSHSITTTAKKLGISPHSEAYFRDGWLLRRKPVMREWSAFLNGRAPIVEQEGNLIEVDFQRAA